MIFEAVPERWHRGPIPAAVSKAAAKLGLMSVVRGKRDPGGLSVEQDNIIPWLDSADALADETFAAASMVMVSDRPTSSARSAPR